MARRINTGGGRNGDLYYLRMCLNTYFKFRHRTPGYADRARQVIKIIRAHQNYLALHSRLKEVS